MKSDTNSLPDGFVFLGDVNETIILNPRYSSKDNFMGRCMPYYSNMKIACTKKMGEALDRVQKSLQSKGYSLVVYDAYRPASTTLAFVEWCKHV